ncbi:isocitrate lyase/phosphoenolpyruvate mutase family protein [Sinomicrobium pectinilyticum]|uniref:Isocitrate lyase/phosphoenolpyruvate mutase family protein n=1 Tax=Sinomicrobium pectinilyticum TaxID=1084421 RepID=A0A3N0ESJ0_SINP1|nr:isocitrate lyase/phosphoenolpyruvate mutase family protein [Sinomicrobium pectinilyticum]RNL90737.1 isocitrate lyase/phosphoenolpyruvate mutase family protein [Sinomicrobium pectinilyticum]
MSRYEKFLELHDQPVPLFLGNVWDVKSAVIMEQQGFRALGTSSAAISHMLGYEDGENLSFDELLFVVKRIAAKTGLPLSVDIEGGYGREISRVIENLEKLFELGVVGINIEDSRMEEERVLLPAGDFSEYLREIKKYLERKDMNMFINARTDTFLLGTPSPREETVRRAKLYGEAGADGVFVPCIVEEEDIRCVVSTTALPVNVMCVPGLPPFDLLRGLGVRRISMGNFMHARLMDILKHQADKIRTEGSFKNIFENAGNGE